MPNYRRVYIKGGTYFFTVNLQNRQSSLLVDHVDLLRSAVQKVKHRYPFIIDAFVVLPDHLHAIWTLSEGDDDYSRRWRLVKQHFTKFLYAQGFCSNIKIWQRSFWEHTIRDETDFKHHFDYVHVNPLKHGYVQRVQDWPYSTFHREVKKGVYEMNWCGSPELIEESFE